MATTQPTGTTIYMVEAGEYEDRHVLVIATTAASAQRYADHHNAQRDRRDFAEVSQVECIPADWAPHWTSPVGDPPIEFCGNCHAECASDCYCAEPFDSGAPYGRDPATQRALYPHPDDFLLPPSGRHISHTYHVQAPRCLGCVGAGTGTRCCICGGLR